MCFEKIYKIYEKDKTLKIYRIKYSGFTKNILKTANILACAKTPQFYNYFLPKTQNLFLTSTNLIYIKTEVTFTLYELYLIK